MGLYLFEVELTADIFLVVRVLDLCLEHLNSPIAFPHGLINRLHLLDVAPLGTDLLPEPFHEGVTLPDADFQALELEVGILFGGLHTG